MPPFPVSRRAFGAALSSVLLLGPVPARAAPAGPRDTAAARLAALAEGYYRSLAALFPLEATEMDGDPAYEAAFAIEIAPRHRERQRQLYQRTLARLGGIERSRLDARARLTHDMLAYEARTRLAQLAVPSHLMPMDQMGSMPVRLAQWASGTAAQPLRTAANYDHFLRRLQRLPAWTQQAIDNMRVGMARGIVLPRVLVERIVPQLDALVPADLAASPYLDGLREFPPGVPAADRQRLRAAYRATVGGSLAPALRRLRSFMGGPYLAAARDSAGIGSLAGGADWYRILVRASTTTSLGPDEIHAVGVSEVARIRGEMERVKAQSGFSGTLDAFLEARSLRPELRPFATEADVLAAFGAINERVKAGLPRLFERAPRAALEIRAVDAIQRATASSNYLPPASDGSRPGIFYAAIVDPAKFETTGMTALFLHEGQPGHHYQIALQQELDLPRFRKAGGQDAFMEGWALYAEGLGRELGLYDDANAWLGRLLLELHRALRLVVDTGLHHQGWSHAQAIAYLRQQEGSSEDDARRAVERYMAWPGQALAYKIGELKILELRERASRRLGARFDLRAFHSQVLGEGSLPLTLLEARIDDWIAAQR